MESLAHLLQEVWSILVQIIDLLIKAVIWALSFLLVAARWLLNFIHG